MVYCVYAGDRGGTVVKVVCYKSEGWCFNRVVMRCKHTSELASQQVVVLFTYLQCIVGQQ